MWMPSTNYATCSLSFSIFLKLTHLFILQIACLIVATSYMSDVLIVREWKRECNARAALWASGCIKLHPKLNVLSPVSKSIELISCMSTLIRIFCKTTMQHLFGQWRFWFMRQEGGTIDELLMPSWMLGLLLPFTRGQQMGTKWDQAGNVTGVHNLLRPRALLRSVNSILHTSNCFHQWLITESWQQHKPLNTLL